jgi:hypothetical protein
LDEYKKGWKVVEAAAVVVLEVVVEETRYARKAGQDQR